MLLLAWSAQAGGFFAGANGTATRVYQNEGNVERARRSSAGGVGTAPTPSRSPGCSPSPSRGGDHRPAPRRGPGADLEALSVGLDAEEARWLNLEA